MGSLSERAQALMKELEQERDELRVKMHLAKTGEVIFYCLYRPSKWSMVIL